MHLQVIAKSFEEYFKAVYRNRPNVPEIQKQETRQAFFSGAHAMLQLMKSPAVVDTHEDTGVAFLESIEQELKDYKSQRVGGELSQN